MRLLTQEQHDYLASIVKGRSNIETTAMMNEHFNLKLEVRQIKCYKKNHNLSSGLTGRFEKGHVPANKGIRPSDEVLAKCSITWFKKGHANYNHKPIGSERVTVDGYIEIKVAEPNKWKLKHRVVWEEHNGPIPKGKLISFVDGNPLNCTIENFVMIDKQINGVLNHIGVKARSRELVAVASGIVQIREKVKELRK